jgi:hypothetical protein
MWLQAMAMVVVVVAAVQRLVLLIMRVSAHLSPRPPVPVMRLLPPLLLLQLVQLLCRLQLLVFTSAFIRLPPLLGGQ